MSQPAHLHRLLSFPYINMSNIVHTTLLGKARTSSILETPNRYQLLYSFHVKRRNFKKAATTMYEYADRLRMESPSLKGLTQRKTALLATISVLQLVPESDRWIHIQPAKNESLSVSKRKLVDDFEFGTVMQRTRMDVDDFSPLSADPSTISEDDSGTNTSVATNLAVDKSDNGRLVTVSDIQLSQLLLHAHIQLLHHSPSSVVFAASASETIEQLRQLGLFDIAFTTAHRLSVDMSSLFQSLTLQIIGIHQNSDPFDDLPWLESIPGRATSSDVRVVVWSALVNYLKAYDGPATNWKYHGVVVDALLSASPPVSLPKPLLAAIGPRESDSPLMVPGDGSTPAPTPAARPQSDLLLRILILRNNLEEAARLATQLLSLQADENAPSADYIPLPLIDQLSSRMTASLAQTPNESLAQSKADLQSAFQRYIKF
eukprot:TRINITY_DN3298_c1_g1_i1.p1 TRINITY_DN3298_c1_g1~~TRINITY_DN3298_c1_g1_i1.p1  ORF type:complete len:431 (-),score=99.14 TRINITY_DN3298_c1_g1_i1:214-1506(-)